MSENDAEDLQGPNPDPAVDENLDIDESETDPGASPQGPHPDPPVEDEVDEASKESFPSSDPPASWAGSDEA